MELHTGFRRLGKYVMYGSIVVASIVLWLLAQSPAGFKTWPAFMFLLGANAIGEALYESTKSRTRVGRPIWWFFYTVGVASITGVAAVLMPVYAPGVEGSAMWGLSFLPCLVMLMFGALIYAVHAALFHVADGFRSR